LAPFEKVPQQTLFTLVKTEQQQGGVFDAEDITVMTFPGPKWDCHFYRST
jgi:hypothetical protein